ncbi:cell surface protein, partial [Enterococcus sp. C1]
MKRLVKLSFFIVFILSVFSGKGFVYADDNGTFTISPINPDTGEVMSNYFDLMVKPKEEKTLTIRVFNDSDKESNIRLSANNGATNDNGITSYLGTEERDETLKVAFTDLVSTNTQELTLAAHSQKDVNVHITMPEEPFDGEVLGGIRVTSNNKQTNTEADEQKTSISNNIAYTIGVV